MASLAGRELKFFFTSPLFIILELAPVILITILNFAGSLKDVIPNSLLPIVWLLIVFYSTYFELELWRKGFLSKGVRLKVYTIGSPYAPFLGHSIVSLVLLELKTLIFIPPFLLNGLDFWKITVFLVATHVNWLFSLSIGSIFSKDVFNKMKDSIEVFLCLVIFNAIVVLIVNSQIVNSQNQSPYSLNGLWPMPSLENGGTTSLSELPFMTVSFFILILFIVAVYVNSMVVKGLRMDSS
ncbi:MAG: hypothetical protein QXF52_03355 [Thermoproteota archaeon]